MPKRCSARTIHLLIVNTSSGLSFLWRNLTLSERVCIKEIIKINLTPKVSFELVKYENLHQVWAKNWQRKDGHFGCTASVVVLFASFFFRRFSLCCLTGHSQSFLMLVKMAHNYLQNLNNWNKHMLISIKTHWVQFRCWWKRSSATMYCGLVGGETKKLLLKSVFSQKQW